MLHLTGSLSLEEVKRFRQLNSLTPGHPEAGHTAGVEVTTGPLGQGIAQAVGMSLAAAHLSARYGKPDFPMFETKQFVIVGDGCLQEGVSGEASSLAGHLGLGNLIVLYDKNFITIDGSTDLSFTENVAMRYRAYGWHVLEVENGDLGIEDIQNAVQEALNVTDKPSLICVRTTIGYGSEKENTEKVHGSPLSPGDLANARQKYGLTSTDIFDVPVEVAQAYAAVRDKNTQQHAEWCAMLERYKVKYPALYDELRKRFDECSYISEALTRLPVYTPTSAPDSTRNLSHKCLNAVAAVMPEIIGGSADLTESNKSNLEGETSVQKNAFGGRYIRFGVREHAMAAICNGMFAYGGMRPFAATFLNFMTYAWGAIRLAAISKFGILYIATHDSIELGEDGPTHQPVETLSLCRATPNMITVRPADGNEVSGAYALWLMNRTRPTMMALCRSNVPHLEGTSMGGCMKGAYIIQDFTPGTNGKKVILGGCGSELCDVVEARALLHTKGHSVRVVSVPSWELFFEQSEGYRKEVLAGGEEILRVYVETSTALGHHDLGFERSICMTTFGASAPKKDLMDHFGFSAPRICEQVEAMLAMS